ncbi:DNA polymerase IV [Bacillus songklensis]|uniref:DNA polymerase IV n=1 Tax=Bacillus songklensis TaxID=1069116 RepID=A0ABV8B6S7_9BACI
MKSMYPRNGRVILHVDCNAFYASVETAYDPSLKDKPLVIAGNPNERRGIIITCNYVARALGIYTTMPLWEAKKKCPDLVIKPPNFELYRDASAKVFEFLSTYTNKIEPSSIDESYLDITDLYELGSPLEIAGQIQKGLLETLNIPVSIGIAPNKFLAKTASDMKKPMGITVLRKRDVAHILWDRQVKEMHGIGEKTAQKLNGMGIRTIGELAQADSTVLQNLIGITGVHLKERANGIDHRPVDPDSVYEIKTVGNSTTLPKNVTEQRALLDMLAKLSQSVSQRMKKKHVITQNVQITIKYSDFKSITRSRKLLNPVLEASEIYEAASQLFKKHWNGNPVRLLGVTALDVMEKNDAVKQLDLFSFEEEAKQEPLLEAVDKLKQKFGDFIIQKGSDLISKGHQNHNKRI